MSIFNHNGVRYTETRIPLNIIEALTKHWKEFVETISPYTDNFHGRGIVICAGGDRYFSCCWVLINILRKDLGCTLPIEVWYIGDEMRSKHIKALSTLDVICSDFLDHGVLEEIKGYAMKPLAIILSSFEEVLYLDADNICVKNPEFLFDLPEYNKDGALFWPDFWVTDKNNPIWEIIEHPASNSKEQESGQILINKKKCWSQLNLALYFNVNKHIYYNLLHGDKDTFRFAWLALRKEFHFINHDTALGGFIDEYGNFIGNTMIQYLPDGSIGFLHRNLIKWDRSDTSKRIWQKIKKFKAPSSKRIYLSYWNKEREHYVMNLEGDVDIEDFGLLYKNIEKKSLNYLQYARDFLIFLEKPKSMF